MVSLTLLRCMIITIRFYCGQSDTSEMHGHNNKILFQTIRSMSIEHKYINKQYLKKLYNDTIH